MVLLLQMLARGTCIDGTACTGTSSCGGWGGTGFSADTAWRSPYFSSAMAAFNTSGSVTVLIRVRNPNGCGTGRPNCFSGGSVQYRLDTREYHLTVLLKHLYETSWQPARTSCP